MYFRLVLENGHMGAGRSIETVRYFRARNTVDLFSMAARGPRMKGKLYGTGVKLITRVSRDEYEQGIRRSRTDNYLNIHRGVCSNRRKRRKEGVLFH